MSKSRTYCFQYGSLLFISLLLANVQLVAAQNVQVTGLVKDSRGPVAGVSIREQRNGKALGQTGDQGTFKIEATEGAVLIFSCIGYKSKEIGLSTLAPNRQGNYNVNVELLPDDANDLDEVVVVGFGTQKKVNLTGAVGIVSAKDLEARPVQNVTQALQGVLPGLNISTQGLGGTLNAGRSVNVRGTGTISGFSSGSPLVLIDGSEGSLDALNPQDIESISVLKDAASSAVYGSRAPFGVILVTTKKGASGKARVNYNNSFRWSTPVLLLKMMNSYEFATYWNDADYNGGGSGQKFSPTVVQKMKDYIDGLLDPSDVAVARPDGKWDYDNTYGNVDWMREYYRDWAPANEHNLSISGGSDKWTYYLSGNYLNQGGFMRYGTDKFNRYGVTAKISGQLRDNLNVEYMSRLIRTNYGRPTSMTDGFYDNVMRRARPNRALYDPNGFYMSDINYVDALQNGGRRTDEQDYITQQLKMTYTPIKDLNIIGELNYRTETQFVHEDAFKVYSRNADGVGQYVSLLSPANDYVYEYARKLYFFNPNLYANYTKSINDHNVKLMMGFQSEWTRTKNFNAQRMDLITTELPVLGLTGNPVPTVGGGLDKWSTAGFFGRINYDYKGRYLLEGNLRYDGSSRFRRDARWNWFPSVSAGWNIAQEDFFRSVTNTVQMLKLRASYGKLGNQNTLDNWNPAYYPTYQTIPTGTANGNWLVDGARPNTSGAPGLISTSLTWEKIRNWNFGLDWQLLNGRLSGSFDYYMRYTDDGLGRGQTLPATLGTSVPLVNNIDIVTKGFEFTLAWDDKIGEVSYGARLNLSDSRTKVLNFYNLTNDIGSYIAGQYINNIWGYHTIGIARTKEEMDAHLASLPNGGQNAISGGAWEAGDIMYADLNGDGKVDGGANSLANPGDRTIIGNSTPRYAIGVNFNASWKGFDASMFWQGILKRDWAPSGMVFWGTTGAGDFWSTALKDHLDYFRADPNHPLGQNLDSYYPRPLFSGKNQQVQTGYLLDASYIRLKNFQLGYTLPNTLTRNIKMSNVRLFASGENLLTFTKLNDTLDPESIGIGRQGGTVYPLQKVFAFGINANF